MSEQAVKLARLPRPLYAVTSSGQETGLKCRTRLFAHEENETKCISSLNGISLKRNPFAMVKDSVSQSGADILQLGSGRQSVLELQQPLFGLDDSLDDSGLFRLYLGEQVNGESRSQQQETCGIEMESEEDRVKVAGYQENSEEKNGNVYDTI